MWNVEKVRQAACDAGLEEIYFNYNSRLVSFISLNGRVTTNVYWTTRSVGTYLNHYKNGITQLFRANCSFNQLQNIMRNPRTNVGKGYHRRSDVCINTT